MLQNLLMLGAISITLAPLLAPPAAIAAALAADCCTILELRQYTLHPNQRDAFIPFFEREFIETQEDVGNTVIGQFRDLDNVDHFTWLRGFRDMPARADALQAFYGGDVWKAHRDAANAYFIDTDNVLLLHAVNAHSAFDRSATPRAAPGATQDPPGLLVATVYTFAAQPDADFAQFFATEVEPELGAAGIGVRACYVSETSPNNFPRLPVRDKDHVFVWFALFKDGDDYAAHRQRLEGQPKWRDLLAPQLTRRLAAPPQVLRLKPTPRSALHG